MKIKIIEMPLDFGASRHGSDMGPSAIRLAGIRSKLEQLGHTVDDTRSAIQINPQEYEQPGNPKAKYLDPIVKACTKLAAQVDEAGMNGEFPLVLGGDHSIALGSIAGFASFCSKKHKNPGVLYVDAHGDFNTDATTPSGNIHGECMSATCGYGLPELTNLYYDGIKIKPENVCYVGCRDIDPGERILMKKAGVTVYTMSDIDRQGFPSILQKVRTFFSDHKIDSIHISFDMDVLDPAYAPGTGIQLSAGLTNREALLLMEEMSETQLVDSAEIVEVNPVLDVRNQTATLAVELAARILGEKLY